MARSTITITPLDNVINYRVINNKYVTEETHDSDMDVFTFEDKSGKQRRGNLMGVSLYNDLLIKDGTKYKILRMLTR